MADEQLMIDLVNLIEKRLIDLTEAVDAVAGRLDGLIEVGDELVAAQLLGTAVTLGVSDGNASSEDLDSACAGLAMQMRWTVERINTAREVSKKPKAEVKQ